MALMIKQLETKLAADNQGILKQWQLLQNLCPDQPRSSQTNRNYVARARPRPRPKSKTTQNNVQQTSCNLTSMQAQLSELQKMLCKISEASSVKKGKLNSILVC